MEETSKYSKGEFIIREKSIVLDKYVRDNIANAIPSVHRDIKIHLLDELYNVIRNLHFAIYNKGNIRIKYITEIIINISLIDYLFGYIKDYDSVNKLKLRKATKMLLDVRNMIKKWKLTEESKKNENR